MQLIGGGIIYKSVNEHYKQKFGCKVYKLSVNAGLTCPNRDGSCGKSGCIFCLDGSGDFASSPCESIAEQLENAKRLVEKKNKQGKYIAYFQAFTNTYAHVKKLERLYTEAIALEYIVGLSVATRPDCLSDEVIALLSRINKIKPVSVELGLQTVHPEAVKYIRRGYENEVYFNSVKRLRAENIEVVTHIIIGLPFEDEGGALITTKAAVSAKTDGVKFHLLHVLKGTDLECDYLDGKFECLTLERYAQILKDCIGLLPKDTVVHRITGDGNKKNLVAPQWSADKKRVLNYLNKYLKE